jgi:hypothetical protein
MVTIPLYIDPIKIHLGQARMQQAAHPEPYQFSCKAQSILLIFDFRSRQNGLAFVASQLIGRISKSE